jgi:hypothetical protein
VPRKVVLSPEAGLCKPTPLFRAQISRLKQPWSLARVMHHDMSSHIAVLCELFVAEVALERLLVLLLVPPGIKS